MYKCKEMYINSSLKRLYNVHVITSDPPLIEWHVNCTYPNSALKSFVWSSLIYVSMFLLLKTVFFSSFRGFSFKVTLYISCFRNNREIIRIKHFSSQKNDDIFPIINQIRESGMPLLKCRLKIITLGTLMIVF